VISAASRCRGIGIRVRWAAGFASQSSYGAFDVEIGGFRGVGAVCRVLLGGILGDWSWWGAEDGCGYLCVEIRY
jgi:hypothetical protein